MTNSKPYLIQLKKYSDKGGDLSYIDEEIPFDVKRIFWVYNIEKDIKRGLHAHQNSDKCLVCMHKSVDVTLTDTEGRKTVFNLNDPSKILFFPRMHWIDLNYEKDAILVVFASSTYKEDQFIKDLTAFRGDES